MQVPVRIGSILSRIARAFFAFSASYTLQSVDENISIFDDPV
jgi:hypothetical protein